MLRFYTNENFPLDVAEALRAKGHDVLTSHEMGKCGIGTPDEEVLSFATQEGRCLLTSDRLDYLRLHRSGIAHSGIIICTQDLDFERWATHIHEKVSDLSDLTGLLLRVYRGGN